MRALLVLYSIVALALIVCEPARGQDFAEPDAGPREIGDRIRERAALGPLATRSALDFADRSPTGAHPIGGDVSADAARNVAGVIAPALRDSADDWSGFHLSIDVGLSFRPQGVLLAIEPGYFIDRHVEISLLPQICVGHDGYLVAPAAELRLLLPPQVDLLEACPEQWNQNLGPFLGDLVVDILHGLFVMGGAGGAYMQEDTQARNAHASGFLANVGGGIQGNFGPADVRVEGLLDVAPAGLLGKRFFGSVIFGIGIAF